VVHAGAVTWRCAIAVDVGGTFTDLVIARTDGTQHVAKVPSVPTDPSQGVFDALHAAGDELGMSAESLLQRCDRLVHGSTVATNAILTGSVAKVGLITTQGFRDSLEIRRGIRADQWDHRAPWPPVLVPRSLRLGVHGRIDENGDELSPLAEEDVHTAVETFRHEGVDAVAICLLHSYRNPTHEMQAAAMVRRHWPAALTTVSSELVPLLGEYARTSTSVVNAGLVPAVGGYLQKLAAGLADLGLARPLLMLQSNGGTVPVAAVASRPVDLVLSGPAAVGGATRRLSMNDGPVVSMEIGGTSCDVAVTSDGDVAVVDGLEVGGYHLNVPAVDVHTVGAGGGTVAAVDPAGLLRVGPEGAGADPGPACYGRGGTRPTATDAHLILGRLRPGPYAGGSVVLDESLAIAAMGSGVGRPLGLAVEDAALGVLTVLEQHLRHAVETITIERGRDPRQMTLVAAGGAGGLHGSPVARALGCARLTIPAEAGVFCAFGMLNSDLRRDVARSVVGPLADIGMTGILAALREEQSRADALVADDWPDDVPTANVWHIDLRYPGQLWSVRVTANERSTLDTVRRDFESEYERLFGHTQPGGTLEITAVGTTVIGQLPSVPAGRLPASVSPTPIGHRRCWVDADVGWVETPVYAGETLGAGSTLHGPYLIEARTTTVLGVPGDRLTVSPTGDMEVALR